MSIHLLAMPEARSGLLQRIDSRLKVAFVVAALMIAVLSARPEAPAGLALGALTALRMSGLGWRQIVRRLTPAVVMAVVVFLTQALMNGHTPYRTIQIGNYGLSLYSEGIANGILLMLRLLAGVWLMLFLTATTAMEEIIFAVRWYRFPTALIEIMTIAYRYIFILLAEIDRVGKAQRMRLGHTSWWRSVQSHSIVGGIVLLRVFEKSELLYRSMRCRGYTESMEVTCKRPLSQHDAWAAAVFGVVLAVAIVLM